MQGVAESKTGEGIPNLGEALAKFSVGDIQITPDRARLFQAEEQYFGVQGIPEMKQIDVTSIKVKKVVDSYNDYTLWNTVKTCLANADMTDAQQKLATCIITLAVNGYGNGNYGEAIYKDEKMDIKQILVSLGVKFGLKNEAKCSPEVMTPKRLIRLYRVVIHDYLVAHPDVETYLYRKYLVDKKYREYTFQMAEHYITLKQHADSLLAAYHELDRMALSRNPTIADKGSFSFRARGVLKVRGIPFSKELPGQPVQQGVVPILD